VAARAKAEKGIKDFRTKATKALHRAGIEARRAERNRKIRLKELQKANEFPGPQWLIPIRDPEKSPTDAEKEALEPGPDLLQALEMAKEELNSTHHKPIEIPGVSIDPM
jgi:hypothetical protein